MEKVEEEIKKNKKSIKNIKKYEKFVTVSEKYKTNVSGNKK